MALLRRWTVCSASTAIRTRTAVSPHPPRFQAGPDVTKHSRLRRTRWTIQCRTGDAAPAACALRQNRCGVILPLGGQAVAVEVPVKEGVST